MSGKYIHSYIINKWCANSKLFAKLRKRNEVEHSGKLCVGKVMGLQRTRKGGKETGLPMGEECLVLNVFHHKGAGNGRDL